MTVLSNDICSYQLKVYFSFSDVRNMRNNYDSYDIADRKETFRVLKLKVLEKLGLKMDVAPHCFFTVQRLYSMDGRSNCTRPGDNESVIAVIEREEMNWAESIVVIFHDIREDIRNMSQPVPSLNDFEIVDPAPVVGSAVDLIPESTEFAHQNVISYMTSYSAVDNESKYEAAGGESIPSQILNEVEVSCLKSGRLSKVQNVNGKESYKDVTLLVTHKSVWYCPFLVNTSISRNIILQEISLDNAKVSTSTDLDSSGCTFTIVIPLRDSYVNSSFDESDDGNDYVHHTFKTRSASECVSWVECIQQRSHTSSENDIIYMADEFTAEAEKESSMQDVDILVDCTTFEGTLKNGYMREKFQSYLGKNYEDESLLFWEYCEDYRKGHPESTDPFDFSSDLIFKTRSYQAEINATSNNSGICNVNACKKLTNEDSNSDNVEGTIDPKLVLAWAKYIYNKFIVDGAAMQIACPSRDRNRIEEILSEGDAPPDLFYIVQTQIYNQLKFQKFADFVKCSNFRNVLLSTVMNNVNQCPVTGQIWCTVSPTVPTKLITSPADFYPSIFPKINSSESKEPDATVESGKYSLLSWSPGQYDMTTFDYSESLKYEVEKDYINNYGKIPLDHVQSSDSNKSEKAPLEEGRFSKMKKSFSAKFVKSSSERRVITESSRFTSRNTGEMRFSLQSSDASASDINPVTKHQGIIPTPWRFVGEVGLNMSTRPHWMPFYWWRYVNPNFYQTYDQSYDDKMFEMLPGWIQCIVIKKINDNSRENVNGRRSSKSSLMHNYTKAANKFQTAQKVDDNNEEKKEKERDVILHTCSSPIAHGISFTTDGGYEHKLDPISVPHLARLTTFRFQWATLPIPGPILSLSYSLVSYSRSGTGFKDILDRKSLTVGDVEDELERQSTLDSAPNNNINQNELLSKSSRRLCLLSFTSNGDIGRERFGEIRLFGTNYCDLYATIRLSCIVKLAPSVIWMNAIEFTDESGAMWHLCPDDISCYNNCLSLNNQNYKNFVQKLEKKDGISIIPEPSSCRIWLRMLSQLCPSQVYVVHILHEGFLSKRGRLNTAFRRRWFIMTSECQLLYYSRSEIPGQSKFKGCLNLMSVSSVDIHENGKDFVVRTSARDWVLRADSRRESESWKFAIDGIRNL